jgi:hypothetical protein
VKLLRRLARQLVGVRRTPTYYLPWVTRPGLTCTVLVNNIERRFHAAAQRGGFTASIVQHDADGGVVREYIAELATVTDTAPIPLEPTRSGAGMVTVAGDGIASDLYVALDDGETYTATHGRFEFIEHYPRRARLALQAAGALLGLVGRTLPIFTRDQFAYVGPDHRSHILLLNLADVSNRIRVIASHDGAVVGARLATLAPLGAHLLDVAALVGRSDATRYVRLRLEGNAWFNLYLVGAGSRDLAGPLSLMHVK